MDSSGARDLESPSQSLQHKERTDEAQDKATTKCKMPNRQQQMRMERQMKSGGPFKANVSRTRSRDPTRVMCGSMCHVLHEESRQPQCNTGTWQACKYSHPACPKRLANDK